MIEASPSCDELPVGTQLALDPTTRALRRGRLLLGGAPLRAVRLTGAGAHVVARWIAGEPLGARRSERALARVLVRAGLVHPRACAGTVDSAQVDIVVIARDRPSGLRDCLASLAAGERVLVVDDGSSDAEEIGRACADYGARLLRHRRPLGPAAARNSGLRATDSPLVGFVDSDCRVEGRWLDLCVSHFADPAVGVVGGRVTGPLDRSLLGRFERVRSPLDLGPRAALVSPQGRVSYLPATALVVRRSAAGWGFSESLRFGEDVEFVWRTHSTGWVVRYEPNARALHPHRRALLPWLGQRAAYGSSASALALRHPGRVSHLSLSPSLAAPWLMALAGAKRGFAVASVATFALSVVRLPGGARLRLEVAPHLAYAQWQAADQLARALRRAYLPALVFWCARSRRARLAAAAAVVVPGLAEWATRRPRLDPVRYVALCALDDASYAAGLWYGCLRWRTITPLVPRLRSRL